MNRESDGHSTDDYEQDPDVRAQLLEDHDREITDDEAGEVCEGEETEMGDETAIGETVTKGGEDGPKKKTWTRIQAMPTDPRTEDHHNT
jgi:hypothetical protein